MTDTTDTERRVQDAAARLGGDGSDERAAARVAVRADGEGLVDVAYARVDSPLGTLLAAATPQGLVRLAYGGEQSDPILEDLARRVSPRVLELRARLEPLERELDEYFEGARRRFDLHIDLSLVRGFGRRVLESTAQIPYGEAATYRDIAIRAGSERATRAAGNALGANPIAIVVPCHRVVRTGGGLGGYTGGLDRKEFLLGLEGRASG